MSATTQTTKPDVVAAKPDAIQPKTDPPAPKFTLSTDVGPDADAAAMAELSRGTADRFESGHAIGAYGASVQVGQWIKPPGFDAWWFVRLIPKNHPNERTRAANERLEYDLKQFGWCDAPKGTSFVGAESDGQYRRWLCCPPDVKERWDKRKREQVAAQNSQKPIERLRDDIGGQRGVRSQLDVSQKTVQLHDPRRR